MLHVLFFVSWCNDVNFICIFVTNDIIYCVTILFLEWWNLNNKNINYVGVKHKLFACNSNMNLNELKLHKSSRIEIDSTTISVNINLKYDMNG